MPTPSMQGSRLPRMFPTTGWGANVSAPERSNRHGGGGASGISGAASTASGSTNATRAGLLGGTLSSLNESSPSHHHHHGGGGGGGGSPSRSGPGRALLGVPTKIQMLEQYVNRFPLNNPEHAPPIQVFLGGGGDSAIGGAASGNKSRASVKFATSSHGGGGHGESPQQQQQQQQQQAESSQQQQQESAAAAASQKEGAPAEANNAEDDDDENDAAKKAEREMSSRRAAREAAKQSFELLRRQKVDSWIKMAERNLRKVRRENETLSALARLTQSNALVNDERYEKALESLRAEAELADELRQVGFGPMMQEFAERIDNIQRDMQKLVIEANKRTVDELAQMREKFDKELEQVQRELEEERNSGLSTKLEWVQKNRELHRAVTEELFASDELARDHSALDAIHRKRRLDVSLTTDEVELLEETVSRARKQNGRLKDRLGSLECELSLAQAKDNRAKADRAEAIGKAQWEMHQQQQQQQQQQGAVEGGFSSLPPRPTSASLPRPGSAAGTSSHQAPQQHQQHSRPPTAASGVTGTSSSGSTDEAVAAEAQSLFDRINETIGVEARNLQTARYAHTEALKQRTELEVYLKHAILQYQTQLENLHYSVRGGIKADSGGTGVVGASSSSPPSYSRKRTRLVQDIAHAADGGVHRVKKVEPTVFTVEDRQAVVDSLLSLPRVLTLMFDPMSAANRLRRKQQERRKQRMSGRQRLQQQEAGENENDDDLEDDGEDALSSEEDAGDEEQQMLQQQRSTGGADSRLYDDLAKLGVDVVGSRQGFLFHGQQQQQQSSRPRTLASAATASSAQDPESEGGDGGGGGGAPSFLGGQQTAPAPLSEEELWERWSRWSRQAEKHVAEHVVQKQEGAK